MNTRYKVEIDLSLKEDLPNLDWLFQAIQEMLETGESLKGRFLKLEGGEK